jgi:Fe-Mn family superoxide dismutase
VRIVSQEAYNEHHELYRGYMSKVQQLLETPKSTREWSRDYNYSYSGARLHQLYFEHLNIAAVENKKMLQAIKQSFGSVSQWGQNLHELAMTCRPAGWALTCYNSFNNNLINIAFDSHDHLIPDMTPLVVLDAYEHAYWLDYGTDKAAYFQKFIETMNWDLVWSRFEEVSDGIY